MFTLSIACPLFIRLCLGSECVQYMVKSRYLTNHSIVDFYHNVTPTNRHFIVTLNSNLSFTCFYT